MANYKRSYTNEAVITAVKKSFSWAQVLRFLNLCEAGGNYKHIQKVVIEELDLNISHFKGRGWNLGGIARNAIPLEICLKKGYKIRSDVLKKKLLKAGKIKNICVKCGTGNLWKNEELVLELDHKDGDNMNNELKNLRLLCPNCHSQTPNFRGRKEGQVTQLALRCPA